MGRSPRRRDSILTSVENMCEQLLGGDVGVTQTLSSYLALTGMDKYTEQQANKLIRSTIESMDNQSIIGIQQNLAMYALTGSEDVVKFYKWLNSRLIKVLKKEWSIQKFFGAWDKAYDSISDKMNSEQTKFTDRIGIANIVMMVNDLKGDNK